MKWWWAVFLLCVGQGQASCKFACPRNYNPVCGSDGVTYSNLCTLELEDCIGKESVAVAYEGECVESRAGEPLREETLAEDPAKDFVEDPREDPCDFGCPDVWDPVCGSDGVTYSNECDLLMADCLSPENIVVSHPGECNQPREEPCDENCHEIYDPVCGSDGVTYPNLCYLELANCQADGNITLAYAGQCKEPCDPSCPEYYDPVCGSDGVTYDNICFLELADCQTEEEITLAYTGVC